MPRRVTVRHPEAAPPLPVLRRALVRWYDTHGRDLPWRRTRDPYAIWVSEVMLQQTRVEVVVPFYESFLRRFPSVTELAGAPVEDVLRSWAGLGYYRRARHLHQAARTILQRHGGRVPRQRDAVRALAGIGDYTAGAILSIAFGQHEPIVDGNVMRVFARLFALRQPVEATAARRQLWEWARQWARGPRPDAANQALMELGATLCARTSPRCTRCPLRRHCAARHQGLQEELPLRAAPTAAIDVELAAVLLRQRGRTLLLQRPAHGLLQGFWELPTLRLDTTTTPRQRERVLDDVARRFEACTGLALVGLHRLGDVRHGILNQRLRVRVLTGRVPRGAVSRRAPTRPAPGRAPTPRVARGVRTRPAGNGRRSQVENLGPEATPDSLRLRWTTRREMQDLPCTTLTRKVLRAADSA